MDQKGNVYVGNDESCSKHEDTLKDLHRIRQTSWTGEYIV